MRMQILKYLKYLEIKEIPFSLGLAEKTYQSLSSEKKGHIQ